MDSTTGQHLNGLQVKSIKALTELSAVFNLANNWIKPKALAGGGYVSTHAMKVNCIEKEKAEEKGNDKTNKSQSKEQGKQAVSGHNKEAKRKK
jgi:hypothetical protein